MSVQNYEAKLDFKGDFYDISIDPSTGDIATIPQENPETILTTAILTDIPANSFTATNVENAKDWVGTLLYNVGGSQLWQYSNQALTKIENQSFVRSSVLASLAFMPQDKSVAVFLRGNDFIVEVIINGKTSEVKLGNG